MTEQAIESRDITVTDIFQAFYQVPNYQREYVWKTEHVEQLLNDINAERAISDPDMAPEYFIGSIVVCPGNNSVLELIDGQQRMTTLFLTLCAIRDRIKELKEQPPGPLEEKNKPLQLMVPPEVFLAFSALAGDEFGFTKGSKSRLFLAMWKAYKSL